MTNITKKSLKILLSILCMAMAGSQAWAGFSGDFSQPGGAVFDGGDADFAKAVAVDTITAGGPYVYVAGRSSDTATGRWFGIIIKYGPTGLKIASDLVPPGQFGDVSFINLRTMPDGSVLACGYGNGGMLARRYDSSFNLVGSVISPGRDAFGIDYDAAGNVFIAGSTRDVTGNNDDWVIKKFNPTLTTLLAGQSFSSTYGEDSAIGIRVKPDGNVLVAGTINVGDKKHWHLRLYDGSLSSLISSATYTADLSTDTKADMMGLELGPAGSFYVTGMYNNGTNTDSKIVRFGPDYSVLASTKMGSTSFGMFFSPVVDAYGNLIVSAGMMAGVGFEKWIQKYTPDLVAVSSEAVDMLAMGVAVDSAGYVYAAGSENINNDSDPANNIHTTRHLLGGGQNGFVPTVFVSSADISPANYEVGREDAALRLSFNTNAGTATIHDITVRVHGTGYYWDYQAAALYYDKNKNGMWDKATDELISSQTVTSQYVTFPINGGDIGTNPVDNTLFVTLVPAGSAAGKSLNLIIDSSTSFSLTSGIMADQPGYPIASAMTPVTARNPFSGDFSQPGGAVYDGGDMDYGSGAAFYDSNIYVVGASSSSGVFSGILAKYNQAGNVVSSAAFSGLPFAAVAADSNGVYVTGQGNGTGFVTVKYTHDLVLVSSAALAGDSSATDVALDNTGNVYVIGSNFGESGSQQDYKFVKYDANLVQISSPVLFNAGGRDEGKGIAVDNGNVYVTGDSLIGGTTYFVTAKFDSSLAFVSSAAYANAYIEADHAVGEQLAVNANTHEVYFVGTNGTADNRQILTIKYSENLQQLGTAIFSGVYELGTDITLDNTGNVYTLGKTDVTNGPDYPVLLKYDANLVFVSSAARTFDNGYVPLSVAMDTATGNSYVTGVDEGPSPGKDPSLLNMRTLRFDPLPDGQGGFAPTVYLSTADVSPMNFMKGEEDAALKLVPYTQSGQVQLSNLRVHVNPAGDYHNVASIALYADSNGNGVWDAGTDKLLSSATVNSQYVNLPLPPDAVIDTRAAAMFLTLTSFNWGSSVNLGIDSAADFTLGAGAMAGQTIYPVLSAPRQVVPDSFGMDLASDGSGVAFVVYDSTIGLHGYRHVQIKRVDGNDSTVWGPKEVVAGYGDMKEQVMSDGSGGAIVGWRSGEPGIFYAQRYDANGNAQWATGGVQISSGPAEGMFKEAAGGGFNAVFGYPRQSGMVVVGQRIDNSGMCLWPNNVQNNCVAGSTGTVILPSFESVVNQQTRVDLMADFNEGGIWFLWGEPNINRLELYAAKVSPAGALEFGKKTLSSSSGDEGIYVKGIADGSGGAYVTWTGSATGTQELYAGRFDSNGNPAAGWPGAKQLSNSPGFSAGRMQLAKDEDGFAVWYSTAAGPNFNDAQQRDGLRIVRVSSSGAFPAGWSENGKYFANGQFDDSDNSRNVLYSSAAYHFTWHDWGQNGQHVYYQKMAKSGDFAYAGGYVLGTNFNTDFMSSIAPDVSGGVLVGWKTREGDAFYLTRSAVIPPYVLFTDPADTAVNVSSGIRHIDITFNEPIFPNDNSAIGTNLKLRKPDGSYHTTRFVSFGLIPGETSAYRIGLFDADLSSATTYIVELASFTNASAAMMNFSPFSFTTTGGPSGPVFYGDFSQPGGAVYDGGSADNAEGVAVDTFSAGGPFVYVVGETSNTATGRLDSIVIKYNSAGVKLASAAIAGAGDVHMHALAIDPSGNLAVGGYGGPVTKFDSSLRVIGSTMTNVNDDKGLAFDVSSNLYVVGGLGSGNQGWSIKKYGPSMNFLAAATYAGTTQEEYARGVAVDGAGYVFVSGLHSNGATKDWKIRKYDSSLNFVSDAAFAANLSTSGRVSAPGLAMDGNGNIFVAGDYSTNTGLIVKYSPLFVLISSAAIDGGPNTPQVAPGGEVVVTGGGMLWKFDNGLGLLGFKSLPYSPSGVALDNLGNAYVSGSEQSYGNFEGNNFHTTKYDLSTLIITHAKGPDEFVISETALKDAGFGPAYGGGKFLAGYQYGGSNIGARLFGPDGTPVGSQIVFDIANDYGSGSAPIAAFDGTNFLLVWNCDITGYHGKIRGQLIDTFGNKVNSSFWISTPTAAQGDTGNIAFDGANYFVVWEASYTAHKNIYGQFVSTAGSLVGPGIAITNKSKDTKGPWVAYVNGKHLVTWREDDTTPGYVKGQFVLPNGTLSGSEIVIDSGHNPTDIPALAAADNTRFLVMIPDNSGGKNHAYGRFVSTDGTVSPSEFAVSDAGEQFAAWPAWDGSKYLITWNDSFMLSTATVHKRYFDASGNPLGTDTVIASVVSNKAPVALGLAYDAPDNKFLTLINRADVGAGFDSPGNDLYGLIITTTVGQQYPVFSGDFSQPGGAVYDGGAADLAKAVAVDTITAGGPFIYTAGRSSDTATGRWAGIIIKYGPTGLKIAYDVVKAGAFGDVSFITLRAMPDGSVLAGGYGNGGMLARRYDSSFNVVGSTVTPGRDVYALDYDAASNVFIAGGNQDVNGNNDDWVIKKFNPTLTALLAQQSFSSPGVEDSASGIRVRPDGNVLVTGTINVADKKQWHMRLYDGNLSLLISSATYNVDLATDTKAEFGLELGASGSFYVTGLYNRGANIDGKIVRFGPDYSVLASTALGAASFGMVSSPVVDSSGNVVVSAAKANGSGFDAMIEKFTPDLAAVSSAPVGMLAMGVAVDTAGYVYSVESENINTDTDPANNIHTTKMFLPEPLIPGSTVYVSTADVSPAYFTTGREDAALRIAVYTLTGQAAMSNVKVHVNPTVGYQNVASIALYADGNGNGVWDPDTDPLISSAVVTSEYADLPVAGQYVNIDTVPHYGFITLTPASPSGSFVNLVIDSTASFTLASGVMANQNVYPVASALTRAQPGSSPGENFIIDMVSDGTGGAFVIYDATTSPHGYNQVFVKRADQNGIIWGPKRVGSRVYGEMRPQILSDGAGGAIVGWMDPKDSVFYAQRFNADGAEQWISGGIQVSIGAAQGGLFGEAAGGGVFAAFGYAQQSGLFAVAQKIDNSGYCLWPGGAAGNCTTASTGTVIIPSFNPGENTSIDLIGDGGAMWFVWSEAVSTAAPRLGLYGVKVSTNGSIAWGRKTLSGTSGDEGLNLKGVSDGSGGAYVAWTSSFTGTQELYARRFDSNGNPAAGWSAAAQLSNSPGYCAGWMQIVRDDEGFAVWYATAAGDNYAASLEKGGLRVARMSGAGSFASGWSQNGKYFGYGYFQSDMRNFVYSGGAYHFAWQDDLGLNKRAYYQKMAKTGYFYYPVGGMGASGYVLGIYPNRVKTVLASDSAGGALAGWKTEIAGTQLKRMPYEADIVGPVSGNVKYQGSQGGRTVVGLYTSPQFATSAPVRLSTPAADGSFEFAGLSTGVYYVAGFIDVNKNNKYDLGEDAGAYPGLANPTAIQLLVRGDKLTGIVFEIMASTAVVRPSINGWINYAGASTGTLIVEAWRNSQFTGQRAGQNYVSTGTWPAWFDIKVDSQSAYFVRAFLDLNQNGLPDPDTEPLGIYSPRNQGAESVFVGTYTVSAGTITLADPGRSAKGVTGEGTAEITPQQVDAGYVFSSTIAITVGASGISAGGKIAVGLPQEFYGSLQNGDESKDWFVTYRVTPVVSTSVVNFLANWNYAELRVQDGAALSSGTLVEFILKNAKAPCRAGVYAYQIGTSGNGNVQVAPLRDKAHTVEVTPGQAVNLLIPSPDNASYRTLKANDTSTMTVEARDVCMNLVSTTATAVLSAQSYNYSTGLYGPDNTVLFSTDATAVPAASSATLALVNVSSAAFYVKPTATGQKNVALAYNLVSPATFYSRVQVLAGNVIVNVNVSTGAYVTTSTTVTIAPFGSGSRIAYINFELGQSAGINWHVSVSSASGPVVWETWGSGQPQPGQIGWEGRFSSWLHNGSMVPSGAYFVRIEAGAAVSTVTLGINLQNPQVFGQVTDKGTTPPTPLQGVLVNAFGGGQTLTDPDGNYALIGLSSGAYQFAFTKDEYLAAAASAVVGSGDTTLPVVQLSRAPLLILFPSLSGGATQQDDLWGWITVHTNDWNRSYTGSIRLKAGTTNFDDGGTWDPGTGQFVYREGVRFSVEPGTYTVDAGLPGWGNVSSAVYVSPSGLQMNLPPFTRKANVSGWAVLPSTVGVQTWVAVNAVPASTSAVYAGGGAVVEAGRSSATYTVYGLEPGRYMLFGQALDYAAVSTGPVTVSTSDLFVNLPAFGTGGVLTGTVTVTGKSFDGFEEVAPGYLFSVLVNVWSPFSMNSGNRTVVYLSSGACSAGMCESSAAYRISGLDAGITYKLFASMDKKGNGKGDFTAPGGFPKEVYISTTGSQGHLDFEFDMTSGTILCGLALPPNSHDFGKVTFTKKILGADNPYIVGNVMGPLQAASLDTFKCGVGQKDNNGDCPSASTATFSVEGLETQNAELDFTYGTGFSASAQVGVVNGSTTSVDVNLQGLTYAVSGRIINRVNNPDFNTNAKLVLSTCALPSGYPVKDGLLPIEAVRRDFADFSQAFSTAVFDANRTRVGYITSAGTYSISGLQEGAYILRTMPLKACATCETAVAGVEKSLTLLASDYTAGRVFVDGVAVDSGAVDVALIDGYNASGSIYLENGVKDARFLLLELTNKRNEVVRSTWTAIGNAGAGQLANSTAWSFAGLQPGDFYTLQVLDTPDSQGKIKYAAAPAQFPDKATSPDGLQSDLAGQDVVLRKSALFTGKLRDANSGSPITGANASLLAPNFTCFAIANPWTQGAYYVAASSMAGRPVENDGTFRIGPVIPGLKYDIHCEQTNWDVGYLRMGAQNYAPVIIVAQMPNAGETRDLGILDLRQGQTITGTVKLKGGVPSPLPNIKVTAKPSFIDSPLTVQTQTDYNGVYTLWVSSFVSSYYDVTAAPRENNAQADSQLYKETTIRAVDLAKTATADFLLEPLLGAVTGQVSVVSGVLSYPFGEMKGFPAAAVFLQSSGTIPSVNPLGDIQVITEADGSFNIPGLSTGAYVLRAASLGYAVFATTIAVSGSGTVSAGGIILTKGATGTGRIRKSDASSSGGFTAPGQDEIGSIVAATNDFSEFVFGSLETNPLSRTVDNYTLSGFKPGRTYSIALISPDGKDVDFPREGREVVFNTAESSSVKSIDLTFRPYAVDCAVSGKKLQDGRFRLKFSCSKAFRNTKPSDNDTSLILTTSSYNSLGQAISAAGNFDGAKIMSVDRKEIAAYYLPAGEGKFSIRLVAWFNGDDPSTGDNFHIDRIFDFFTGPRSSLVGRVSNIFGGEMHLEAGENETERSLVELLPGSLNLTDGSFDVSVTTNIWMRKADSLGAARASALAMGDSVERINRLYSNPDAFPESLYNAMKTMDGRSGNLRPSAAGAGPIINPFGSFYDIFLPAGISRILKQPARITLQYNVDLSSSPDPNSMNVWWYDPNRNDYFIETDGRVVDTVNGTISVNVNHLSTFIVLASTPIHSAVGYGGGELAAFNFPNPFNLEPKTRQLNNAPGSGTYSQGQTVPTEGTIIRVSAPAGVSGDGSIKIFNTSGELVRNIPIAGVLPSSYEYFVWDGRNDAGEKVASGVYICIVKIGDKKAIFKMAVVKDSKYR